MMIAEQITVSPIDDSECVRRPYHGAEEIQLCLDRASATQREWRQFSLTERARVCEQALNLFELWREEIAASVTLQMGRPSRYAVNEVNTFVSRGRYMISIAEEALASLCYGDQPGFTRYIQREPLGVIFIVAPWNYPLITTVNALIPALMAGNTVVIKHSAQTPLCAEYMQRAFAQSGAPAGLLQTLVLTHDDVARVIAAPAVRFVNFTGSVAGGAAIEQAAAGRFMGLGLELGGCDPAYVRADADLEHAVDSIIDGALFNSGQSCCGIQRIYVHHNLYDRFVEKAAAMAQAYVLDDPRLPGTTLGPVVRTRAADEIRAMIHHTLHDGATALVDAQSFKRNQTGTAYVAPQLFANTNHSMNIMKQECFGPVAGIMRVRSDEVATRLMQDTEFGLTAAIYSADELAVKTIADQLDTGTVFMNRCDYLDPALAWVGVKNSGRGATLSLIGYEQLTRPKSYHFKTVI